VAGRGTQHLREGEQLLTVEDLVVDYGRGALAVAGVSLDVARRETLGLVGESGSGKSSLARAILQMPGPTSGTVRFDGQSLTELSQRDLRDVRSRMLVVFQDPISSLNPRRRVRDVVAEGLKIRGVARSEHGATVDKMLRAVGLDPSEVSDRRPYEFSGGQCQRISIARALVLEPDLLICDEPVSALDVSVQAQILNLLADLKERLGLSLLFIAHDLAVVRSIADRVAVMFAGRLCEVGGVDAIFDSPSHPYTQELIDAVPVLDAPPRGPRPHRPIQVASEIVGCQYYRRCENATDLCAASEPLVRQIGEDHYVACHFPVGPSVRAQSSAHGRG
jgi:peptide/nickel transport system ATP-binding protein